MKKFLIILACAARLLASGEKENWTGPYADCAYHFELSKQTHLSLGVRFSSKNPRLSAEFRQALQFWAGILDMDWHEDHTDSCAIQLVDGEPALFSSGTVARAQFTEWKNFRGWIAFNPKAQLTKSEMYMTAVHELGHLFGLKHTSDPDSIMYFLQLEQPEFLKRSDLEALGRVHKLRHRLKFSVLVTDPADVEQKIAEE